MWLKKKSVFAFKLYFPEFDLPFVHSQKKTQRTSLLFEDDTDSGSSLFSLPPTSVPPAATVFIFLDSEITFTIVLCV